MRLDLDVSKSVHELTVHAVLPGLEPPAPQGIRDLDKLLGAMRFGSGLGREGYEYDAMQSFDFKTTTMRWMRKIDGIRHFFRIAVATDLLAQALAPAHIKERREHGTQP